MVRGAPLPLAAIFAFVGHGTTKKERLQDPAGRKAEKIWRHVQQEALSKKVCNKGCRLLSHGVIGALVYKKTLLIIPPEVYLKTNKMTDISHTQAGCKAKSCRNPLWVPRFLAQAPAAFVETDDIFDFSDTPYTTTFNSAPFYVWIAVTTLYFLALVILVWIVGVIKKQ